MQGRFVPFILFPYLSTYEGANFIIFNQCSFEVYKKKPLVKGVLRGEPPRGVEPPTYSLRMSTNLFVKSILFPE